jgi:hypothetical protein
MSLLEQSNRLISIRAAGGAGSVRDNGLAATEQKKATGSADGL